MTFPYELDLVAAAELIAERELSPVALLQSCQGVIEEHDGAIKAFTALDAVGALEVATAREADLTQGRWRGPLHGIPVAVKDVIDVEGLPTTAGSKVPQDNVASEDAPVVARLREAGAVILGKTNTHEFALGATTPPTRNPWNRDRIPGGSSGGSAAAVAAGMCLGALGTDTAGSIRVPAGLCGISGLKPRGDALPLDGIVPLAPSHDSCGIIARSAAGVAVLWQALTGAAIDAISPPDLTVAFPADVAAIGDVSPDVCTRVEDARAVLESAGATIRDVAVGNFKEWDRPLGLPLLEEILATHRSLGYWPDRRDLYGDEVRASLDYAERIDPDEAAAARGRREELIRGFRRTVEAVTVLALPVTETTALPADDPGRRTKQLTRLTTPVNAAGLAAAAVSCGFGDDGLPIGIQFVAADEATALGAALAFQRLTSFHEARPALTR